MIIVLNGLINSGKTTVARILVKKIPNTAYVETDKLREFIDWMKPGERLFRLSFENAVLVSKNLVKNGFNVILTYILTNDYYKLMKKQFRNLDTEIYIFTFNPDIKVLLSKRGLRKLTWWEIERNKYLYYHKRPNNPSFGKIIDNTDQTPQETARLILNEIKNPASRERRGKLLKV